MSLALLLTVTSNILGIFTMPFILPHIAQAAALTGPSATTAQVVLEPLPLMLQLCQTILVPTLLGASIRGLIPGAAAAIDRHKKSLSYINAGLLASVPWMQVRCLLSGHVALSAANLFSTWLSISSKALCVVHSNRRTRTCSSSPPTLRPSQSSPAGLLSMDATTDLQDCQPAHGHRSCCHRRNGGCCRCGAHHIPDTQHSGMQVGAGRLWLL